MHLQARLSPKNIKRGSQLGGSFDSWLLTVSFFQFDGWIDGWTLELLTVDSYFLEIQSKTKNHFVDALPPKNYYLLLLLLLLLSLLFIYLFIYLFIPELNLEKIVQFSRVAIHFRRLVIELRKNIYPWQQT